MHFLPSAVKIKYMEETFSHEINMIVSFSGQGTDRESS